MSLEIEPDIGVPYSDKIPSIDLRTRVEAASNTTALLAKHGLEVEPSAEDNEIAAKLTLAYAEIGRASCRERAKTRVRA